MTTRIGIRWRRVADDAALVLLGGATLFGVAAGLTLAADGLAWLLQRLTEPFAGW